MHLWVYCFEHFSPFAFTVLATANALHFRGFISRCINDDGQLRKTLAFTEGLVWECGLSVIMLKEIL
jgi:hypothetical protein